MKNQPKLTKLINQKLPPQHGSEVIQKGACWYVQTPTLMVFIGNSSGSALQYIKDLQAKPEHALMQLFLDSNEFGATFLEHIEHLNDSPTMLKNVIGGAL